MKKPLIILLFIGFCCFGQTFEVVNNGYYYGKVGETILPNRTTDLKALTDVQEYLEKNNLENGEVLRPTLKVTRKKTVPITLNDTVFIELPPITIRDTVYIDHVVVGNPWMGEPLPISVSPIYGTTIGDRLDLATRFPASNAFDGDITSYYMGYNTAYSWIGQDYGQEVTIKRFRFLPKQKPIDAIKMNKSLIQHSNDGVNWVTIYIIDGITETNYTEWIDVSFAPVKARYFRLFATQNLSYCMTTELEFYTQ